jgi:predicted O-methyltransferase YrrM
MGKLLDDFYGTPAKTDGTGITHHLGKTSPTIDEVHTLQRLLTENGFRRTLEIGLALGGSAVGIAEVAIAPHTVLDPFQHHAGNVGLNELARLGLDNKIEFHAIRSEEFLHDCVLSGRQFDFVFIDGGHSIGQKVTDVFLADKCLAPGGMIVLHDAFLRSSVAAVDYLHREAGYSLVQLPADVRWKRAARLVRYTRRFGMWYAPVIRAIHRSLVALKKAE